MNIEQRSPPARVQAGLRRPHLLASPGPMVEKILRATRKLIRSGYLPSARPRALDAAGAPCRPLDRTAVAYSLPGAIEKAMHEHVTDPGDLHRLRCGLHPPGLLGALDGTAKDLATPHRKLHRGDDHLTLWNETGHTRDETIALLDRALERHAHSTQEPPQTAYSTQ